MATWGEFQTALAAAKADGERMRVTTATGSVYEFEPDSVRRVNPAGPLRRDGDWLAVTDGTVPAVGRPMVLFLEPLGEGDSTERRTTPVVSIEWVPKEGVL